MTDGTEAVKMERGQYLKTLKTRDKVMPLGALALGMLFVYLFFDKEPGISMPIFITAFYVLFFAYNRNVLQWRTLFGWFLCIPVILLSLTFALFGNQVLKGLDMLALLALIPLQTMLLTSVNSYNWASVGVIADLFCAYFCRSLAHVPKPFGILFSLLKKKNNEDNRKSVGGRVAVGLLIALPLVLILLGLLSSADLVFGNLVGQLPKLIEKFNLDNAIAKIIITLIIALGSFSYLWSVSHGDRPADVLKSNGPAPLRKDWLDPVIVMTVTAAVDALYILFVIIQFAYLFGGFGLPAGFTYAEYARHGFFELIVVTLLNIGFLGVTLTFTKKSASKPELALRILNTVMVCCTLIMLVSAFYRMSLYETAYGYTFLRIMTQAFMILLLLLFLVTLARVWKDGVPLLKPYLILFLCAFVVVNYINVDKMIVRQNIERYHQEKMIDVTYLRTLSNDILEDVKVLAQDKDPFVASAVTQLMEERKQWLSKESSWQSFNLADQRGRKALESMAAK